MKENATNTEGLVAQHKIIADPGQKPVRLDKFLNDRLPRISRNRIQNGIRAGAIKVGGRQVKPNYKVRPGDEMLIVLPRQPRLGEAVAPEDIPLDILYEDSALLVVNKPAGMVVHPGVGNYSGTLVNALAWHLGNEDIPVMEGNLRDRPGLVHRLDKDTTGLLVIAKTDYSMTHLARQFFDRTVSREYTAIVWGVPEPPAGKITGNIGRHPRYRTKMAVLEEDGKHAVTHYKVHEDLYYISVLRCRLDTGRTHQIRVHLSDIRHPVFNDARYGGDQIIKGTVFTKYKQFVQNCFALLPRQALHARTLGFEHPETGKRLFFEAQLPEDMERVLNKWRTYVSARKKEIS